MTIAAKIDPKYEIVKKLREGGMGAIYLVRHRLLDELRVVKVLRSQLTADEDLKERFLREAKIAIHLRHPNIAQLYDFSLDDEGTAYIVLEYIDGITLEEYCRQPEARHLPLTLAVAQQALRALGYLHRKGFVHRDIAPDNLMLTRDVDGQPLVKLIDLGIVKILKGEGKGTATALYLGKPKYSSPEQLVSQDIDARSDLYSFGVLLYELATGVYPIHGHDLPSLITGHLHRDPVPFEQSDPENVVPPSLRKVIFEALEKDPKKRIPSAEEFARRLAEVAAVMAPESPSEARQLLEAAREGAQRARDSALSAAEREIRGHLTRRDFGAAREQLAEAVERLGNDTRLAELQRSIEAGERDRREADRESTFLTRLADEAEAALDRGDLPEAMSKVFEIVAKSPEHERGKALQERIERLRRESEAAAGGATGKTVLTDRNGKAKTIAPGVAARESTSDEPTGPVIVARAAPPSPSSPPSTAPAASSPLAERPITHAPTPTAARRRSRAATVGVAVVALAVATAGWLLWRALTEKNAGGADRPSPTATATASDYEAGITALARGDASEAARLLRLAFSHDPEERTGYLPQASYGVALARQGNCAEAERLFGASERTGVATRDPLWREVEAARLGCAGGGSGAATADFPQVLTQAEEGVRSVLDLLSKLRLEKSQPAVADLWKRNDSLVRQEKEVEGYLVEAQRALDAGRARQDADQLYAAIDHAADASSRLKKLLAAAAEAARQDARRLGGD